MLTAMSVRAADGTARRIMECPICGSRRFKDFRKRANVRCAQCGSLPRTRATWLALQNGVRLGPGSRVAHFAPEAALARRIHELCGDGYEAYDYEPSRYQADIPFTSVRRCDLCRDMSCFHLGVYDAIVHNHVIEHLPCNYSMVLLALQRLLKPGGWHIFSVPVRGGYSSSNMVPNLTTNERIGFFGHAEHVRNFGIEDHDMNLGMVFGQTVSGYRLEDFIDSRKLRYANVQPKEWRVSGEGIFVVKQIV